MALTIWRNQRFPDAAERRLLEGVGKHRLVDAGVLAADNLTPSAADPRCRAADVAFGQPHPDDITGADGPRFVQLSTAGYTRYDKPEVARAVEGNGVVVCNASAVYAGPCAQHVMAFMLAEARQLPQILAEPGRWRPEVHRPASRLLDGQRVLILGYGAIARELARLLAPFHMAITGVRRRARGDEGHEIITPEDVDDRLRDFDHVVNILPASDRTQGFFDAARLGRLKPGAVFYNIGRGNTVQQDALAEALAAGRLAAAYLDVTDPEPLPPDHPLWHTSGCFISPHTAGGMADEADRLVEHFLANLGRYERGETLVDLVLGKPGGR